MRFENKVAVVASSGGSIGLACVEALQEEGARVAFLGSDSGEVTALSAGPQLLPLKVKDFTDEDEMQKNADTILAQFGTIDVLVTALTCPPPEGAWNELSEEMLHNTLDAILTGSWLTVKYMMRPMVEKKSGRIVLITSVAGRTGVRGSSPITTAAYAGLGGIIRDVATVFGKDSITANGVAVGPIEGQYFEPEAAASVSGVLNRPGTGRDVAEAVMYLADEHGAWNTGEIVDLNGGFFAV
ncbi:MAG: SDR family oxidoreductase [Lachnospiraceae bacterium]|nr:SDR family oxidoreductase [Lachnospiraceae bacterium]